MGRVIKFFCSLRLTVFLLCAGLALVFLGTLAQVDEGLYEAQSRYFRSWLVWRPTLYHHHLPLLLPGGYLIGTLLLLNLVSAHIKRFRFSIGKIGIHLTHGGLILLLLGQLLTDMLSRESSMRLEEGTSSNYSQDFRKNELTLVNVSDPSSDTVISIPEDRLVKGGVIRHPSLPVTVKVVDYWPNCEIGFAVPADAVPAPADHGTCTNFMVEPVAETDDAGGRSRMAVLAEVFTDKGSLGTYLVIPPGQNSDEQTVSFQGADYSLSCLFAPMLGGNLLAVSKAGDMGGASTATFPEAQLRKKGEMADARLPFKLRVKEFWPACRLFPKPGPRSILPVITRGGMQGSFVTPEAPVTDSEHRNFPGAVVELADSGKSLGTWLLWAGFQDPSVALNLAGKPYIMALQFKRYYEPYRIGLMKFTHDQYKGTDIPSNFASRLRVINPESNEDRAVDIRMNSPLRYKGKTYYQASFEGEHVSVLQVVKNPGWLTPYFACILVGLGLVYQFGSHLIKFATKRRTA